MPFLTYDTADDIISSLEIIEKLLFPETDFWHVNYSKFPKRHFLKKKVILHELSQEFGHVIWLIHGLKGDGPVIVSVSVIVILLLKFDKVLTNNFK